jgi:glucose/arabinose dehydrogenase
MIMRWLRAAALAGSFALLSPADAQPFSAVPVKMGLAFPTVLSVAPGGLIFYGERLTGEIHTLNDATGEDRLWATISLPGDTPGKGLMSIAFHPNYPATPHVYVSLTRAVSGQGRVQLLGLTENNGIGTAPQVLFSMPAGTDHNASQIIIAQDGLLYMAVGDTGVAGRAQNLSLNAGKWLRMTLTGGIPANNPFGSTRVWARGVRNTIGATLDPLTGRLWSNDNGPECNEELNIIRRGANYGWGASATCNSPPQPPRNTNRSGPSPQLPLVWYAESFGPTGAAFCSPCGDLGPTSEGALFFAAFNTGHIRRVRLTSDRLDGLNSRIVYDHPSAVLAVTSDKSGSILFTDPTGIYRLAP